MLEMGIWVNHGATVKEYPCYCPVVKCRGDLEDIYVCDVNDGSMEYPEMVNREALKIYASSDARWNNNTAIRDLDNLFFVTDRWEIIVWLSAILTISIFGAMRYI